MREGGEQVTDLDLFDDAPAGPEYGVRAGRYRFPPPPGVQPSPNGWMRMSNLVGAFSDQRALQLWLEKRTLLGLLADDGVIFDELAAIPDGQLTDDMIKEFAEKARTAAGAVGARHGTARHAMLEHYLETGQVAGHRRMASQMDDLLEEMDRHDLEFVPGWSERVVWHPIAGGTMGRLDARVLCRRTGQVGVLDLKTQRRFWTYQEIAGQQCGYDSAEWVWEGPEGPGGRWVPYAMSPGQWSLVAHNRGIQHLPAPTDQNNLIGKDGGMCAGKRVAILAHMPSDGGRVQLHEVDLEYGAQVLSLAAQVVALRSRGKSVTQGRGVGGLRPCDALAIVEA
jgi:hypothetical protein